MLEKSGDLIPVKPEAVFIPWTKRKSQVLNYLHRGIVYFETHVYDTNVGDISPLSAYFNPERWTVNDLNHKFGIQPQNSEPCPDVTESNVEVLNPKTGQKLEVRSLCPRLLIYPLKYEDERRQPLSSPEPGSSCSTGERGSSPNDPTTSFRRSSNEALNQFMDLDDGFSLFKTEISQEKPANVLASNDPSSGFASALSNMANHLQSYSLFVDEPLTSKAPTTALCFHSAMDYGIDWSTGDEPSEPLSSPETSLAKFEASLYQFSDFDYDRLMYVQETLV
ncbi:hypothetical protein TCAL_11410 [Tigriopus californicus]|uniref:Uncharacterized protein n=1 Tax=Tigriopus californicus TaxID=6832 RepID=A0A553NDX5_TIGCA|nr:hypothetical protein TCAL_11410 [Tigriopus californicus]